MLNIAGKVNIDVNSFIKAHTKAKDSKKLVTEEEEDKREEKPDSRLFSWFTICSLFLVIALVLYIGVSNVDRTAEV